MSVADECDALCSTALISATPSENGIALRQPAVCVGSGPNGPGCDFANRRSAAIVHAEPCCQNHADEPPSSQEWQLTWVISSRACGTTAGTTPRRPAVNSCGRM